MYILCVCVWREGDFDSLLTILSLFLRKYTTKTTTQTLLKYCTRIAYSHSKTWRRSTLRIGVMVTCIHNSLYIVGVCVSVCQTVIMLRSGRESRRLDCVTSRDPRLAFPFVALLNHSNVATMETFLEDQQPEFLWIGFECE